MTFLISGYILVLMGFRIGDQVRIKSKGYGVISDYLFGKTLIIIEIKDQQYMNHHMLIVEDENKKRFDLWDYKVELIVDDDLDILNEMIFIE